MHVAAIWRYPVKSMMGETIDRAELGELGIIGDRVYATRDLERGGIRGAKKIAKLMTLAATASESGVTITLPDGRRLGADDPDVHDSISAAVDHPVHLEALQPADDLEHYRRGAPDSAEILTEMRSIFGRTDEEPLPDFSVFPSSLVEFESPPGTYYDAFPLLVITTTALRTLATAVGKAAADVRRFRPSLVLDVDEPDGYPEFAWKGRWARLGSAEIEFLDPCPRCVMVTRHITAELPADRTPLRHVVAELDQNFGQYARITVPGSVVVGDAVEFIG